MYIYIHTSIRSFCCFDWMNWMNLPVTICKWSWSPWQERFDDICEKYDLRDGDAAGEAGCTPCRRSQIWFQGRKATRGQFYRGW